MKIKCVETHRVSKTKVYNVPESELINEFGSIEACKEAIEEDSEQWQEFTSEKLEDIGYDVESEDWITERDGGFETEWEIDG